MRYVPGFETTKSRKIAFVSCVFVAPAADAPLLPDALSFRSLPAAAHINVGSSTLSVPRRRPAVARYIARSLGMLDPVGRVADPVLASSDLGGSASVTASAPTTAARSRAVFNAPTRTAGDAM
jgi:hypothetical protein